MAGTVRRWRRVDAIPSPHTINGGLMLILERAADAINITLGGVPVSPVSCTVSYRHIDTSTYAPQCVGVSIPNASTTEIIGGSSGFARVVDHINVYNPNVANVTVSIGMVINAASFVLRKVVLAQDECLQYQEGSGWSVSTQQGAIKNSLNQGTNSVASGDSVAVLSGDVINNNAVANTLANVTGLLFPVTSGTRYWFEFVVQYNSAATTTGSRWTITGPASPTSLAYRSFYSLTTTSGTFNEGLSAYQLPAASNASSAATTNNIARVEGIIFPSANGDVQLQFASEIASSAVTARAGSFVRYRAL